jgi:hypothetical protein
MKLSNHMSDLLWCASCRSPLLRVLSCCCVPWQEEERRRRLARGEVVEEEDDDDDGDLEDL